MGWTVDQGLVLLAILLSTAVVNRDILLLFYFDFVRLSHKTVIALDVEVWLVCKMLGKGSIHPPFHHILVKGRFQELKMLQFQSLSSF